MAVTISQQEGLPTAYPATPTGATTSASAAKVIWDRIEARCAHRWTARQVTWIVEGEGEWTPPLAPATITSAEVWESHAWTATTLNPSALGGFELPGDGPYRFTATVGGGEVPPAVAKAFVRLAEYIFAASEMPAGASKHSLSIGDAITRDTTRNPAWLARAMDYSGAADLLRPYRSL
ncbi:MAG: hypothetical protein KDK26_15780 [Roseivivax sp.]|nr:hypothetical protein [Roseivivax sp.]